MKTNSHHSGDLAWDDGRWAVVIENTADRIIDSGLSATEAMRQSAAINWLNSQQGVAARTTIRFIGDSACRLIAHADES